YGRPITIFDHLMTTEQLLWLLLMVIGAFAAWKWSWPWVLTIAVHVLLYMAVVAQVRYMLTALPLVIALAAVGADKLLARFLPAWGASERA
ncbi:MAG TPA: hypothetical protein PK760_12960, partial [Flavobacteriales bacterium]|nr:hypothetical protein [Flavobacteriales bacterium]